MPAHRKLIRLRFVDPTLEHDLTSQERPWALSPLIATMPHFVHTPSLSQPPPSSSSSDTASNSDLSSADEDSLDGFSGQPATHHRQRGPPEFPSSVSLRDDVSQLRLVKAVSKGGALPKEISKLVSANKRRAYFSMQEKRKSVIFGPSVSNILFSSRWFAHDF